MNEKRCLKISVGLALALASFAGCSSPPIASRMNGGQLLQAVCQQGGDPSVVTGAIWAQVQSPEMKGQFPATFRATASGALALEVTDLMGTAQAWLKIDPGQAPELKLSAANRKKMGNAPAFQWAGLPLEFASTLFLGKVPCPAKQAEHRLTFGPVKNEGFEVRDFDERSGRTRVFLYSFREFGTEPWVERLEYRVELAGKAESSFVLNFMDPTDPGAYAKRWQATSSEGELKVRWKDRSVQP